MQFNETPITGAYLIELRPHRDDRGYFARCWCEETFEQHGLNPRAVQTNVIYSHRKGTLRGVHFQLPPFQEVKLVRCLRGEIYDVAVDLRTDSPTYLKWHAVHLKEGDLKMYYVPEGCGHGYQSLTDDTEIQYQASCAFAPQHAKGVRYDDSALDMKWPLEATALSEADANWPAYSAEAISMTMEVQNA